MEQSATGACLYILTQWFDPLIQLRTEARYRRGTLVSLAVTLRVAASRCAAVLSSGGSVLEKCCAEPIVADATEESSAAGFSRSATLLQLGFSLTLHRAADKPPVASS